MKCLVVDDEYSVRKSLILMGRWKEFGFEKVFEAENGEDGLKILCREKPDLIITDMKMGKMDGIHFLNALSRMPYQPKVIVISGYSDFEYMRSAIHVQAVDYILKPVGINQFNESLEKSVSQILNRNSVISSASFEEISEIWLRSIKTKNAAESELVNSQILKEFSVKYMLLDIFILRLLNFDTVSQRSFNKMDDLLYYHTHKIIENYLKPWRPVLILRLISGSPEFVGVIGSNTHGGTRVEEIESRLSGMMKEVEQSLGLRCLCGVSQKLFSQNGILSGYQKARMALSHSNLLQIKRVFFYQDSYTQIAHEHISFSAFEGKIIGSIKCGEIHNVHSIIKEVFQALETRGTVTMYELESMVLEFSVILDRLLNSYHSSVSSLFGYNRLTLDVYQHIDNLQDLRQIFCTWVNKAADWISENSNMANPPLISEILRYVDEHYSEKIDLSTLSAKFYISREYVSKIFKRKAGENFVDYLTRKRLREAQRLLLDTDLPLSFIACAAGFNDEGYLIKVFKRNIGVTPTEYRHGK